MAGRRRWVTGGFAVALAAAVALGGCGGDGGDEEGSAGAPEGPGDGALLPAGSELPEGLEVPVGARLAGAVFRRPGYRMPASAPVPETVEPSTEQPGTAAAGDDGTVATEPGDAGPATTSPPLEPDPGREEWTALLVVEGDPFAVYDALAEQVRALGPALAGSADACVWQVEQASDTGAPIGPYPVRAGEPPAPIDHLRCEASASDGTRWLSVELRHGGEHPGTLQVDGVPGEGLTSSYAESLMVAPEDAPAEEPVPEPVVPADAAPPAGAPAATAPAAAAPDDLAPATSTTMQPPDTLPVPGPGRVEPLASALLPDAAPVEQPEPGERFGGVGNCLASGYDRMVLPAGATLVATVGGPDGSSVLRVDDPAAAIDALLASSAEGPDAASFDADDVQELPLADGDAVRAVGFSISAGGGACDLLESPDGRHLLVTMHSD